MTGHHQHGPPRLEFHHPVAVVRGLLFAAAVRVAPASDAELAIVAAWVELAEPDNQPSPQVDVGILGDVPPEVILGMARSVLHAGVISLTTETGLEPLIRAIGHLDAATAHLRAEMALSGGSAS